MRIDAVTIYKMSIKPKYFDLIANNIKKFEIRLNDSKRLTMRNDDLIKISVDDKTDEYLMLLINNKLIFPNFTELLNTLDKKDLGFENQSNEEIIKELRNFYSEEEEKKLGVVAIEIKVLKELSNYQFNDLKKELTR